MTDDIKIVKRKVTGFFKASDLSVIRQAVNDTNAIITNASILIRAYYLKHYKDSKNILEIDDQLFGFACSIIQGKQKAPLRGANAKNSELLTKFNNLKNVKDDIFGEKSYSSNLSLSFILEYAIVNILTAYKNNIQTHFLKYPKRVIACHLIDQGFKSKDARRIAVIISNHYFYGFPIETNDGKVEGVDPKDFKNIFPRAREDKKPRVYDIECNPWKYLRMMVSLNKVLERNYPDVPPKYKKLLNPLPFHSSFVQKHIRIDTSGLCQLLMTEDKLKEFKLHYKVIRGDELRISSKADMLSSFEKLHGREAKDNAEKGQFATDLWDFLTNLTTCKQWKELKDPYKKKVDMVFDNAVVTDGCSISFQVIKRSKFGRKEFGKKRTKKHEKEKESDIEVVISPKAKMIANDPGKRDILYMTDGVKMLRYTRGQRQQDTKEFVRQKETIKRRRKVGLEDFETKILNTTRKNSCIYENFKNYCQVRLTKENEMKSLYGHPMFRQFKFLGYSRRKSSEANFINKVKETFSKSNEPTERMKSLSPQMKKNARKESSKIVIGWGNWGKNPNALKNGPPTPGIGIRRRFEKHFQVVTVCEHLTSQTCPCCHEERCLKKQKNKTNDYEIHHLLRCSNDKCLSRWWNRNVVGSLNILRRFLGMNAVSRNRSLRERTLRVSNLTV